MRAKEWQLLEILKSLEGQVVILHGEFRAAKAELADLMSQINSACKPVNTITAEHDVAPACKVTQIGNLWTAEVARNAIYREVTKTRRRANLMETVLIHSGTEVDDCLGRPVRVAQRLHLGSTADLALLFSLCMKPVVRT